MRRPGSLGVLAALAVALAASGCASAGAPPHRADSEPPAEPPVAETDPESAADDDEGTAARPSLRALCRESAPTDEPALDAASRRLQETFCSANLWFDGLFGGHANLASARGVSGRVELSGLYTEFAGLEPRLRLRLRYELPNLEHRLNVFLGRDDRDQFVEDRIEGFALRSSVFGLDRDDEWLAGLGWSPPGRYSRRVDFRVGGRIKSAPEVFLQGRWRRQLFVGERTVWRFRETVFWENRDGFGSTSGIDVDRVLSDHHLLRWSNVGTFSQATEGLAWRSALISYRNLGSSRALAGELFVRGSTAAEVRLREPGARAILRWPLRRQRLFAEAIIGYSWPREHLDQRREGSAMLGFGVDLLFGREPY